MLGAAAGALGWGIRGQYGHETGAMIAGLLVGLALVLASRPSANPLANIRAASLCAAAVGFGGAMTYGQTIGLTQNPEVVGNWAAFGWGMVGLSIKGALWIGFAGVFLGIGLSTVRYRTMEIALLLFGMLLLILLGVLVLNHPFDPPHRNLPRLYFSADWRWYPSAGTELRPRREIWGGLLFALAGLLAYVGYVRKDRLARNLGLWACLGGLGFPLGQCLQAWHSWNPQFFQTGLGLAANKVVNWWNFMEIIFGAIWGGALALGLWRNRDLISPGLETATSRLPLKYEVLLLSVHLPLLCCLEFGSVPWLDALGNLGLPRSFIPLIAIMGGRFWPYWMALPVVALPILGKTLKPLGFADAGANVGWILVGLGFAALVLTANHLARQASKEPGNQSAHVGEILIAVTWLYFVLNFAFFQFPWPWNNWTLRTPSALVFTVCATVLSLAALKALRQRPGSP